MAIHVESPLKQCDTGNPIKEFMKVQLPREEQSGTTQLLGTEVQVPEEHFLKDPQDASVVQDTGCLLLVPLEITVLEAAATHSVLASPESPTKPDKHAPQECEVDPQGFRFILLQIGAPEQSTVFRMEPTFAITCFVRSIESPPLFRLDERAFVKLNFATGSGATLTVKVAELFALYTSNI
jgi:hypothetical protein